MTQDIDWSGIRAAATAMQSVNAAAEQASKGLPPEEAERLRERINKRAYRERWLDKHQELANLKPTNAKPLSKSVQKGHEIVSNTLESDGKETRIALSRGILKGARHIVSLKPEKIIAEALNIKSLTASAAQVHGWADTQQTSVRIALFTGGDDTPVIDV